MEQAINIRYNNIQDQIDELKSRLEALEFEKEMLQRACSHPQKYETYFNNVGMHGWHYPTCGYRFIHLLV